MADKLAYTAGHFELLIDGAKQTTYLKSLDGGFWGHSAVDEAIGTENKRIKHSAVADVEPISVEIGMAGSTSVMKWIQDSWDKNYQQRSGQINHANFNMETVFEHEFSDALITETTFPALDGASKDAAYLKVKFQPKAVATRKVFKSQKLSPIGGLKQKQWTCSAFRLNIDGIDDAIYTNKIESFTIKQTVKKLFTGMHRDIELCPTKIEFPNISATISLEKADGILAWYDKYVVKGKKDPAAQKGGSLEFLTPNRDKTLFRVTFAAMGLLKAAIVQSTANSDQIKRVKFDMYVGEMKLDGPGALGLE
ncbi:MAG TPA: phage tail protein [Kofleriaceae bacterium]|nr:phage tail protein [Kofleriaceae bacterium]